jgi:hypothetical protein
MIRHISNFTFYIQVSYAKIFFLNSKTHLSRFLFISFLSIFLKKKTTFERISSLIKYLVSLNTQDKNYMPCGVYFIIFSTKSCLNLFSDHCFIIL